MLSRNGRRIPELKQHQMLQKLHTIITNIANITHSYYKFGKYYTQLLQVFQRKHTNFANITQNHYKYCKYYTQLLIFFSQILHTIIIINLILQVLHTNAHFSILTHF